MTAQRRHALLQTLAIAVFVAAISLPLAGRLLPSSGAFALTENRNPAELPTIDLDGPAWRWSIASFPRRFERWWNDSFAFRWYLIRAHSLVKLAIGASPSSQAIVGREGWLYYAGEQSVEYFRNVSPFSERDLARWIVHFDERRAWLAQRDIRYLVVVAPNKETIYPEHMPEHLKRVRETSRLDQLVAALARDPRFELLDLRAPLVEARARGRIYHLTDTHWNDAGALVAKRAIVERIAPWLPGLDTRAPPGRLETRRGPGGDLARLIALEDRLPEERFVFVPAAPPPAPVKASPKAGTGAELVVRECRGCSGPVVVMNHDSFGEALAPLLQPHFARLVLIAGTALDRELIERERPAVVIQQFVERALMCDPRGC